MTVEDTPDPSTHVVEEVGGDSAPDTGKVYRNGPHDLDIDFEAIERRLWADRLGRAVDRKQDAMCENPEPSEEATPYFEDEDGRIYWSDGAITDPDGTLCITDGDFSAVEVPEVSPQGIRTFRSRPRRVDAIFYDGDNLQDIINWLRFQEPEAVEVNGEWEIDEETNDPVDCRFLDLYTVSGLYELDTEMWVVLTELGIELHPPEQFEALYSELVAKAA